MKFSIIVFAITLLSVGAFAHRHAEFRAAKEKCIQSTEIDRDVLRAFWKNKDPNTDDDKIKCFVACFMKELGFMTADGQVLPEKLIAHIPAGTHDRERKIEAVAVCSVKTGQNQCETAFNIAMCLHRHHVFGRRHHRNHKFEKKIQKCKLETKVDPELLRAERRGEDVDDQQVKCFHACMMKKMDMMDENGKVNLKNMIHHIPEDDVNREKKIEMINMCAKKKGDDECETAHKIRKCIHNHSKKFMASTTPRSSE